MLVGTQLSVSERGLLMVLSWQRVVRIPAQPPWSTCRHMTHFIPRVTHRPRPSLDLGYGTLDPLITADFWIVRIWWSLRWVYLIRDDLITIKLWFSSIFSYLHSAGLGLQHPIFLYKLLFLIIKESELTYVLKS